MKNNRKYNIGCSGSGWGIWNSEGSKVCSCFSRTHALETLYELMGWNKPSKWY